MAVVYLMKVKDRDMFKVGQCSGILKRRLNAIQVGCPFPVGIYATIPSEDDHVLEREIQSQFRQVNTRGEWYDNTIDEVLDVLSRYDTSYHECEYEFVFRGRIPGAKDKKPRKRREKKTGKPTISHKRKTVGRPSKYCKLESCTERVTRRATFCSNACKQKHYRLRKKQTA